MSELREYRKVLQEDIDLLGYNKLRYSIFEGEDNNRQEYQIRLEYVNSQYIVYKTADRASVMGQYTYDNIFDSFDRFLNIMQSTILSNRRRIKDGEKPEYDCPLWDN